MKATIQESINVSDARSRRATALCAAVRRHLAERGQYPLSLHEIFRRALEREYLLGRKRGMTDADA